MPDRAFSTREIVVLEREPYWAPELRRQFEDDDVTVRHCGDLSSLAALGDSGQADVLVVGLEGHERECTELLRHGGGRITLVLGSRAHAELELPYREAGVVSFAAEQLSGEQVARRIRRIWAAPH